MALDGIVLSNIVNELKSSILGGRIDKIYQPEKDEIVISVRSLGNNHKLLLTANSSYPRIHFIKANKSNPLQPPMFCMLMRKHIGNGKIIDIVQPNFERILEMHIESANEMGDISVKKLIIEIMGKHSNIILVNDENNILDSVKHISYDKSSVRQVLPGKIYSRPPSQNKVSPMELNIDGFMLAVENMKNQKIQSIIYKSYNGISPIVSSEICTRANVDTDIAGENLEKDETNLIYNEFEKIKEDIQKCNYTPHVVYDDNSKIIAFSSIEMQLYKSNTKKYFDSVSELLEFFYDEKDIIYRTSQKTQDLRKLVQLSIERCLKKKDIYAKTLKEVANREKLKVCGELITSNIHNIQQGLESFATQNFYSENLEEITITLEPNLTPAENAQKYFKLYNKQKRSFLALQDQITQNEKDIIYLDSTITFLNGTLTEADIEEVRQELFEEGILKKRVSKSKKPQKQAKPKPLHYVSSDNFDIYVGKNNKQNDALTMQFASNNDMWLHTKDIAGSHIIIKSEGKEIPNTTLTEAATLAAFYSKGKDSSLVPVDYTQKRFVKKPNGAKPGMVIYETYKTAFVTPHKDIIEKLKRIT